MSLIPESLAAARLRAANERPYLASALWSLIPVKRPGLGTLAVDRYYRLYYDEARLAEWTVLEAATVLIHEITHLLRDHPARADEMQVEKLPWFYATDAAINDDMEREGLKLPGEEAKVLPDGTLSDGYLLPSTFRLEDNEIEEEYYATLMERADEGGAGGGGLPDPQGSPHDGEGGGGQGQGEPGDGDQQQQSGGGGGGQGDDGDGDQQQQSGGGGGGGGGQQQQQQDDGDGDGAGGGGQDGDGQDQQQQNPCGGSGGNDPQPDGGQQPGDGSGDGQGQGQGDGNGDGEGQGQGNTGGGNCGSCAGGPQRPWEDDAPGQPGANDGLKPAEQKLVQRQVAQSVREAAKNRGTVPGSWSDWAEEVLTRRVHWTQEFMGAIRGAVSYSSGMVDYTYQRPSRRQASFPKVVMPSLRAPKPNIVWVQDTSGSMSAEDMGAAFDQADQCFRQCGFSQGVPIISVDARAQKIKRFRPGQKKRMMEEMSVGRGGTDMRVGIEEALQQRPKPCAIVVATDGETPWPDKPIAGVKLIALIIKRSSSYYSRNVEENVPKWARTIVIDLDQDTQRRRA